MTKDDILQMVIDTGDEIYNKNSIDYKTDIFTAVMCSTEQLIAEIIYKMEMNKSGQ